ncbi:hypothetical protein HII31_11137 [Pseudocercospora fuligena]|uniref:Uncharacterized protein n=1 Tax=Pseudocercospora fuligena TaxID=685502 RepID=A0A8H6VCT0_9PEZI|nr:hypothetical protein HII31_11137 [Pseudocercospora fuligena]
MALQNPEHVLNYVAEELRSTRTVAIYINDPKSDPLHIADYDFRHQSPDFDSRGVQSFTLIEVDRQAALVWLAFATRGDDPNYYLQGKTILTARCFELAFRYRLFVFHNAIMRSIVSIKEEAVADLLKIFFQPKFDKAPVRQRLVDTAVMASSSARPFGPLTISDISELDGTGFLVMFNDTKKQQRACGHLPKRTWDKWNRENAETDCGINGEAADESSECEGCETEVPHTRKRKRTSIKQEEE